MSWAVKGGGGGGFRSAKFWRYGTGAAGMWTHPVGANDKSGGVQGQC